MRRTIATIAGATMLALGSGCGGAAPPLRGKTEAMAAIRAAREAGAADRPRAAYHLDLAEEQLRRAGALANRGLTADAGRMLQRAQADAELAAALAEAERARPPDRETPERHP